MKTILPKLIFLILFSAGSYFYFVVQKSNRTLLITGCARSGTSYISTVLRQSNFEIKHEKVGKDGASCWYAATQPPYRKRGVDLSKVQFAHVFHQVRHPLDTISSVYFSEDRHSWHYILKHTPEIKFRDSHLVKCAKYWYYWNLKAEAFAEWTYRVEEIDLVWEEFCRRIGKILPLGALQATPKNINTRGTHPSFTWQDLRNALEPDLYQKIINLAVKYGYTERDSRVGFCLDASETKADF